MTDKEKFEEETLAEFIETTGIPKERIDQYERIHSVNFTTRGETYEFKNPGLVVLFKSNSPTGFLPMVYFPKKSQGISEPVISHSEISGLIYVYFGGEKYEITKYAIEAVEAIKALEQKPTTKNCRTCKNFGSHHGICEICKDNKCWTEQEHQSFKWCTDCKEYDQEKHCCHRYSKVIRDTVAEIRQEPTKGHWIEHPHEAGPNWEYSRYECSECHEWAEDDSEFCPECGAKMEVEDADSN